MDYIFFFLLNFINSQNLKYRKNIYIFAKNNLNIITMDYNKKQMQPLISKYGINVETNKLFIKVCELFDGQSNYQTWAVKMIFSQAMTFEQLTFIHEWIEANGNMISKLDKKNIVSYSNKTAIAQLLKEIGYAFQDSIRKRGGKQYRIKVTSVTRTVYSVSKLMRRNRAATENSCHRYGTTFDISWVRFDCMDPTMVISLEDLKNILAEVVQDFRKRGRCYAIFERKSGCLHITVR